MLFATRAACDQLLLVLSMLELPYHFCFLHIDNIRCSQPTLRVTYCCEYCLNFVLTTPFFRNPRGFTCSEATRDLLQQVLSMLELPYHFGFLHIDNIR